MTDPMGIADLREKLNAIEDSFRMAHTTDPSWVTQAEPGKSCERCIGMENVFRIQLIYDVGTYLCRDCVTEAAVLVNRGILSEGAPT